MRLAALSKRIGCPKIRISESIWALCDSYGGMKVLVETSAHNNKPDIGDTLDALCARNISFEFHYTNMSGDFFAGRSRFLGQDDHCLHLDTPHIVGKQAILQTGKKIDVFVSIGPDTYTFRARIVQTQCRIKLNNYTTVHGIYIDKPTQFWPGQKRHELRLRFEKNDQIPVTVNLTVPNQPNAVPLDNAVVNGWIEDVSAGGCNLHLDTSLCSHFKFGHPIFLRFTLPDEDETETIVQAEVRAIRPPTKNYQTRVGVKFQSWPSRAYLTRTIRPLERFIAKVQRERLKKRRPK